MVFGYLFYLMCLLFSYPIVCPYKNEIVGMGDVINLDPMIKFSLIFNQITMDLCLINNFYLGF